MREHRDLLEKNRRIEAVLNAAELIFNKIRNGLRNLSSVFDKNGVTLTQWPHILRDAERTLTEVATSSEGEFLVIGEKLHHFHARARDIGGISQSIAESISGERTAGIITEFQSIIQKMQDLEAESNRSSQAMQGILEILTTLQKQLEGFGNIIRSLRIMCVSIRIQSSQVGLEDIGFNSLADDVGKLSEEIEDRCTRLFQRSQSLIATLGNAVQKARTLETQQKARVRVLLTDTLKSLETIAQKHQMSSEGAKVLASRYEAIGRSIGNIVMSLQIHDITRQRVEHANNALNKISDQLKEEQNPEGKTREAPRSSSNFLSRVREKFQDTPEYSNLLGQGGMVCELQIAQLDHARCELVVAVDTILASLREVGELVADIGRETRKMAGTADEGTQSSITDLEAGFSSIVSALSDYNAVNRELIDVTASIRETLQRMAGFSVEIESIGLKIKLIALNAIVKAAHFGDEGATLSVLAEAIHGLSVHTFECTKAVSGSIGAIVSASKTLGDSAQESGTGDPSTSHVGSALQTLMDTLKSMNAEIVEQLSHLHHGSDTLSKDIAHTIDGTTVHHQVDEAIQTVVKELTTIVELAKTHCSNYCRVAQTDAFDQLESSYTMQKERSVHQAILGTGAGAALMTAVSSRPAHPSKDTGIFFSEAPPPMKEAQDRLSDTDKAGDSSLDPNIILFDDDPRENDETAFNAPNASAHKSDENVVLFDDPVDEKKIIPSDSKNDEDEDLGDNVELF